MSLSPYFQPSKGGDAVFSVESSKIKFGFGALEEVGVDARSLGMTRTAVYTDPNVAKLEPVSIAVSSLKQQGIDVAVYEDVEVEPTDRSFKAGADFVKTSTGFSSGGATLEDVKLMRTTVGDNVGVKASGGIRDYKTALSMIEAGASRIGASSGVKIVRESTKK